MEIVDTIKIASQGKEKVQMCKKSNARLNIDFLARLVTKSGALEKINKWKGDHRRKAKHILHSSKTLTILASGIMPRVESSSVMVFQAVILRFLGDHEDESEGSFQSEDKELFRCICLPN
jgi:hypothetical protein